MMQFLPPDQLGNQVFFLHQFHIIAHSTTPVVSL